MLNQALQGAGEKKIADPLPSWQATYLIPRPYASMEYGIINGTAYEGYSTSRVLRTVRSRYPVGI